MGPLLSLLLLLLLTLEAALLRMIGTPSAPQWAWREHSLRDGKRKQSEEEANKERWEMKPWKCLISGDCQKLARKVSDSLTLTAISMESKRATQKERNQDMLTTLLMEVATATLIFLKKFTALLRTACLITACSEETSSLKIASLKMVRSTFQRQTQAGAMSTIMVTCMVTLSAMEEMTLIMQLAMTTTEKLTLLNSMQLS